MFPTQYGNAISHDIVSLRNYIRALYRRDRRERKTEEEGRLLDPNLENLLRDESRERERERERREGRGSRDTLINQL